MRKRKNHEYRQAYNAQAYNAQAVVAAAGSQRILCARISQCASDRNEPGANLEAIPAEVGRPQTALADNGYANGDEVESLAKNGLEVLVATGAAGRRRRHDFRPARAEAPTRQAKAAWRQAMAEKLASARGQALYKFRQPTVEPVLGIIQAVLGFTRFSLRGQSKRPEQGER